MLLMLRAIGRRALFSSTKINPYQILGIPATSTEDEVKSAYYKLAKQYHPDLKPDYAEKFKIINEAYNILKDPTKKSEYDELSARASGKENVDSVGKTVYNTHFHYGFTNKYKHQKDVSRPFDQNPFAQDYQKAFSNEFTRNMFKAQNQKMRQRNIRTMNNSVRNVLIGISSFVCIFLVAQIFLNIYKFNHMQEKSIEYDRPDPRHSRNL